jgi:hypothetical protein
MLCRQVPSLPKRKLILIDHKNSLDVSKFKIITIFDSIFSGLPFCDSRSNKRPGQNYTPEGWIGFGWENFSNKQISNDAILRFLAKFG